MPAHQDHAGDVYAEIPVPSIHVNRSGIADCTAHAN